MEITVDVSEISKTIKRDITIILKLFFQNLAFALPNFQQFLPRKMLLVSLKMVFIEKEAALLYVTM